MPNRMLRTRALTSRRLGNISGEAEALYYRLMLVADDFGCFHADEDLVQAACYPRRERSIGPSLKELVDVELVRLYDTDGEHYLVFDVWDQRVDKRATRKFPESPWPTRESQGLPGNPLPDVDVDVDVDDKYFIKFWGSYPRKVGKRAARAAFGKALKRAPADEIVAGAQRYARDPNRDGQFTAHPTTWLNRDSWDDDPLPAKGSGPSPSESEPHYFEAQEVDEEAVAGFAAAAARDPWRARKDLA